MIEIAIDGLKGWSSVIAVSSCRPVCRRRPFLPHQAYRALVFRGRVRGSWIVACLRVPSGS
jgi:hypothetical protein